jgi:chloramphenicol 3-O phosphotransferase
VGTDVVVINGGSSSGKTTIARCLQGLLLPDVWLRWSIDDLVDALPPSGPQGEAAIEFSPDGSVTPGPAFRRAEEAWLAGLAATARSGTGVLLDDVFLGGSASQERVRAAVHGLQVLWVGVHCDPDVAAAREAGREDRAPGMAATQAHLVHRGVTYDVEVDTTTTTAEACARTVLSAVDASG